MIKRLLRAITVLLGGALILNGLCLTVYANFTAGSALTILAGLLILMPSLFPRILAGFLSRTIGKITAVLISLVCFFVIISTVFLFFYGRINTVTYNEDYLVVLGCGIRGTSPTEPLRARLDTALLYLERNRDCSIIVSGGRGQGEDISEAEAMQLYLIDRGIDESRIIKEDKSSSTYENFMYSNDITGDGLTSHSAAFITNDFHIYRADTLAKMQGFRLNHLSAPTSWYNLVPCYLREQLAIIQMIVLNR